MGDMIRSAVFVDLETMVIALKAVDVVAAERFVTAIPAWLSRIEDGGLLDGGNPEVVATSARRIVVRRCYVRPNLPSDVRQHFLDAGFQMIECPLVPGRRRTAADIRLAMDVLDSIEHRAEFDEYILLTGEIDVTPLLSRLREHYRRSAPFCHARSVPYYRSLSEAVVVNTALAAALSAEAEMPGGVGATADIEPAHAGGVEPARAMAEQSARPESPPKPVAPEPMLPPAGPERVPAAAVTDAATAASQEEAGPSDTAAHAMGEAPVPSTEMVELPVATDATPSEPREPEASQEATAEMAPAEMAPEAVPATEAPLSTAADDEPEAPPEAPAEPEERAMAPAVLDGLEEALASEMAVAMAAATEPAMDHGQSEPAADLSMEPMAESAPPAVADEPSELLPAMVEEDQHPAEPALEPATMADAATDAMAGPAPDMGADAAASPAPTEPTMVAAEELSEPAPAVAEEQQAPPEPAPELTEQPMAGETVEPEVALGSAEPAAAMAATEPPSVPAASEPEVTTIVVSEPAPLTSSAEVADEAVPTGRFDATQLRGLADGIARLAMDAVDASERPVALYALAIDVRRSIGHDVIDETRWAGFQNFRTLLEKLLPPGYRITKRLPSYVYSAERHGPDGTGPARVLEPAPAAATGAEPPPVAAAPVPVPEDVAVTIAAVAVAATVVPSSAAPEEPAPDEAAAPALIAPLAPAALASAEEAAPAAEADPLAGAMAAALASEMTSSPEETTAPAPAAEPPARPEPFAFDLAAALAADDGDSATTMALSATAEPPPEEPPPAPPAAATLAFDLAAALGVSPQPDAPTPEPSAPAPEPVAAPPAPRPSVDLVSQLAAALGTTRSAPEAAADRSPKAEDVPPPRNGGADLTARAADRAVPPAAPEKPRRKTWDEILAELRGERR